ncbi:lipoyl synthase [Gammaproteobacteria bacterium]
MPISKPHWIRAQAPTGLGITRVRSLLHRSGLHTVCEEATCPNLGECFSNGTATFLIMGDRCTRRCPFCNIAHGLPNLLDPEEPSRLAEAVAALSLRYVVITSVNRDDLRDGGAGHFADCMHALRKQVPTVQIEILVPDFRGRLETALEILSQTPPDFFNHNLETVPRLYREVRPGADYQHSLSLLRAYTFKNPKVPTKSGLMLGLGETQNEVRRVLQDLQNQGCTRVTLGQYLQPSRAHLPVSRFVTPEEFLELKHFAEQIGFTQVASAPMVRSSYHAEAFSHS